MFSSLNPIKVSITDDHSLFAQGIANLLETVPEISVISVTSNGQELLNSLEKTGLPDVFLLDIDMPVMDGFTTLEQLINRFGTVKVIALSMYKDYGYVSKMILAGVNGYMVKNVQPEDLIASIKAVADGGLAFNQEAILVMKNMVFDDDTTTLKRKDFSEREIEIIELICKECSATEVAEKLNISKSTVESHKKNLFTKMEVTTSVGIAVYAIRNKII